MKWTCFFLVEQIKGSLLDYGIEKKGKLLLHDSAEQMNVFLSM